MFDLSLSPPQIEFILKPGITLIQTYQVTNNSQDAITLNTEVLPFLPKGDNGSVSYSSLLANPNISFSLNNADLRLGQPFTLPPFGNRQLVLKIQTSPNTETSDYYSTFFIYQSTQLSANDTSLSQSIGKIGSHVLLSISNTESPKIGGQINKFSITPKIKDVLFTPLNFSIKIQNNSNYYFKSSGKITISKNKKTIKQLKLDSQNVLANHTRSLQCENQTACNLSPPFWPGVYTATLEFDQNHNIPSSTISFVILPISPIVFILIILYFVYLFRWVKNKLHQAK